MIPDPSIRWIDMLKSCRKRLVHTTAAIAFTAFANAAPAITAEDAASICDEVQTRSNNGTLEELALSQRDLNDGELKKYAGIDTGGLTIYKIREADLDGDGVADPIGLTTGGGTCSTNMIVGLDLALKKGAIDLDFAGYSDKEVESDDDLRWANWGNSDALFRIRNHTIVVTQSGSRKPHVVSLFDTGRRVPLCALKQDQSPVIKIASARDPALCSAVAAGTLLPMTANDATCNLIESRRYFGSMIDGCSIFEANLDNKGQKEVVGIYGYASGAGCGSDQSWIAVLGTNGAPKSSALNQLLSPVMQVSSDEESEFAGIKLYGIKLYEYRGRTYIFGSTDNQILNLFSVRNGSLATDCVFDVLPQSRIVKRYGHLGQ
jgi:hypothetical protein